MHYSVDAKRKRSRLSPEKLRWREAYRAGQSPFCQQCGEPMTRWSLSDGLCGQCRVASRPPAAAVA